MNAKRFLSLMLAVMMLSSLCLFGCEGNTAKTTTPVGGPEVTDTTDTSKIYDAPIKDLGGHEFHFYVRTSTAFSLSTQEVYAEAINGEKINDAVFTRNAQLAEKYNCTIKETRESKPHEKLKDPLLAGDYVCDYIYGAARDLRSLVTINLIADLSAATNINLEKAWYNHETMNNINVGNKTFYIQGDAIIGDEKPAWIMIFNKAYVAAIDPDLNLYDVVRSGDWTLETFYNLYVQGTEDLNGDGVLTIGTDRFGYIAERATNWMHVNACNMTLSEIDANGNYTLPDSPKQELIDVWTALRPVITAPERAVSYKNWDKGLGTFVGCQLANLSETGNWNFEYGVLPMPKLNKDQANYCTGVMASQFNAIVVPNTVNSADNDWAKNGFESGAEQCAYFLEAFSYYSMSTLTPAFFDYVVLKQAVIDEESREMVIMAVEHVVYDFVCSFSFGSINIFSEVGSNNGVDIPGTDEAYDTLVSLYESRVVAARTQFQEYLTAIENAGM